MEVQRPSPGGGVTGNASTETAGDATKSATGEGTACPRAEEARQYEGPGTRSDGKAGTGAGGAVEGLAVSPAAAQPQQTSSDGSAAPAPEPAPAATAAGETPRGEKRGHGHGYHQQQSQQQPKQGQPQNEQSKEPSPPPRTPVRPPGTMFSASSFGRGRPPCSSSSAAAAAAAAAASSTGGKWRPSFGSGGGGRGGGQSPAGAMHAPWAAFSTPSRDRDGAAMPPSGSMGTGTIGSASARRRRGSGAGNGPLGRLLQQVDTAVVLSLPSPSSSLFPPGGIYRILFFGRAMYVCLSVRGCVRKFRSKVCLLDHGQQCLGPSRRLLSRCWSCAGGVGGHMYSAVQYTYDAYGVVRVSQLYMYH